MDTLAGILEYVSLGIGLIAIVIILWGVIRSTIELIKAKLLKHSSEKQKLILLPHCTL